MLVTTDRDTFFRVVDGSSTYTLQLVSQLNYGLPETIRVGEMVNGNDMVRLQISREAAEEFIHAIAELLHPEHGADNKQKVIGAEEVSPGFPPAATDDVDQLPHTQMSTDITAVIYTGSQLTSNPPRYTADLKKNGQTIKRISVACEYPHHPLQEELEEVHFNNGLTLPAQWMNLVSFERPRL